MPVGFKWFVDGLLDGTLGFGGEESAGASFLRRDGTAWSTDKDGLIPCLLAAEMTATTGKDPGEVYAELAERFGDGGLQAHRRRGDARSEKDVLKRLSPEPGRRATSSRASRSTAVLTEAPGNGAPIGGLKVVAEHGWFAARPSGTEDVYKVYAESLDGEERLERILGEAEADRRQGAGGADRWRGVLAIVLAGGEGKRLAPLTLDRAKPAVPFGGNYRLIDFALSNLVNAGFRRIVVLTQYKSHSLDRHIAHDLARCRRCSATTSRRCPRRCAAARAGSPGSADAIYQNFNLLNDERPDYVIVFGADHIYRMDPRQMVDQHIESGAGVTVAALRAPIDQADQFGVIETGGRRAARSRAFREKPKDAIGLPDAPDQVYASMGNYVFSADVAARVRDATDADDAASAPRRRRQPHPDARRAAARRRSTTSRATRSRARSERERGYWRDVGTLDAFYDAHMDLISVDPIFNLYNREWPILTWHEPLPPAKFVFADDGRMGHALDSMVCAGVVVSGGEVRRLGALAERARPLLRRGRGLGPDARRRGRARTRSCGGRSSTRTCVVAPGAQIGVDAEADRERFTVSDGGVVVVRKGAVVEA